MLDPPSTERFHDIKMLHKNSLTSIKNYMKYSNNFSEKWFSFLGLSLLLRNISKLTFKYDENFQISVNN